MEFELNVRETEIYGWQGGISKPKLDALVEAIRRGNELPPVDLIQVDLPSGLTVYKISNERDSTGIKGGHHRTRARYNTNTPLLVNIIGNDTDEEYDELMHKLVTDIPILNDDWARKAYEYVLETDPKYIRIDY